jgi:hypothetical protein
MPKPDTRAIGATRMTLPVQPDQAPTQLVCLALALALLALAARIVASLW